MIEEKYDVIIVGAGPAGTSVAKTCAELGLKTLVLERNAEIGSPKRCGEGLSNNAVKRLGLKIPERCIAQRINGAFIYAPNGKEIKIRFKGTGGYVLERKVFDKWLASEAANAGARIVTKAFVYDLIAEKNYTKGVKVSTLNGNFALFSSVIVAADGAESLVARKAGLRTNKNPILVDTGFQYEMANIDIKDPHMIELYFGNKIARRGYCWVFPKGRNLANVGIGILGNNPTKITARHYLDEFIAGRLGLRKGSIIEVNTGCIPVGGFMKSMVSNGLLCVGDAANQVNPIHGGGIAESISAGRIAGSVIKKAIDKDDVSAKGLSDYDKIWWKQNGNRLANVEKVREMFEKLNDEQLNDLADVLSGEDLTDFAHGRNLPKLAKILIKHKVKGLARSVGL